MRVFRSCSKYVEYSARVCAKNVALLKVIDGFRARCSEGNKFAFRGWVKKNRIVHEKPFGMTSF
jgi:hypothetical protein